MKSFDNRLFESLMKVSTDLSSGLLYTHNHINDNTRKTPEAAAFLCALIEFLKEKGLSALRKCMS